MVQCKRKEKEGKNHNFCVFNEIFGFAKSHGHSFSASFSSLSHKIQVIFEHMNEVMYTLIMLRTSQKIEVYLKKFKDTLAENLWRNICTREISIQFVCGFFFIIFVWSLSLSFFQFGKFKNTQKDAWTFIDTFDIIRIACAAQICLSLLLSQTQNWLAISIPNG